MMKTLLVVVLFFISTVAIADRGLIDRIEQAIESGVLVVPVHIKSLCEIKRNIGRDVMEERDTITQSDTLADFKAVWDLVPKADRPERYMFLGMVRTIREAYRSKLSVDEFTRRTYLMCIYDGY